MPAPIVAGEGVQLVHDDGLQIPEERAGLRAAGDEHDLHRLGCGQQQVGPFPHDGPTTGGADVAVPQIDAPSDEGPVGSESRLEVVQ